VYETGDVDAGIWSTGLAQGLIHHVPTVSGLVDRIIAEGDVHARYAAAVPPEQRALALDAIDAVLAQSLSLDGGRYATPYAFVRSLKKRALKAALPVWQRTHAEGERLVRSDAASLRAGLRALA
jgi:hypothetical protein